MLTSEKPREDWEKLTDADKIERMMGIIKDLQQTLSYMQGNHSRLDSAFYSHVHSTQGQILVPPNRYADASDLGKVAGLANPNFF